MHKKKAMDVCYLVKFIQKTFLIKALKPTSFRINRKEPTFCSVTSVEHLSIQVNKSSIHLVTQSILKKPTLHVAFAKLLLQLPHSAR